MGGSPTKGLTPIFLDFARNSFCLNILHENFGTGTKVCC
jgi:hypothetical protein